MRTGDLFPLHAGEHLWHVWRWRAGRTATSFNAGTTGLGRFNPIFDGTGACIPTWYGARTEARAILESVFHDVPDDAIDHRITAVDYEGRVLSDVVTLKPIGLIRIDDDLRSRLHISRAQLLASVGSDAYLATARWAEYLRRCRPDADGLIWSSRVRESSETIVLFGDRVPEIMLETRALDRPLDSGPGWTQAREMAEDRDTLVV